MKTIRLFSNKKENKSNEKEVITAAATGLTGAALLGKTKTGRLTGKVTRYHNTEKQNVENILKEGIKSKYSTDPNNLTNSVLKNISMDKKEGLVYTAKKRVLPIM